MDTKRKRPDTVDEPVSILQDRLFYISFPGFSVFQEATYEAKFIAVGSSPTVSALFTALPSPHAPAVHPQPAVHLIVLLEIVVDQQGQHATGKYVTECFVR
jgi:hypothetical protein